MIREHLESEKDVLLDVVKASDAIRRKYKTIKMGRESSERALNELFKPVVKPLENLVKEKNETYEKLNRDDGESINYLKQVMSKYPKKDLDTTVFGVREISEGKHMIGNATVRFEQDHISIDNKNYPRTQGLVELLIKKNPNETVISGEDLENYKNILVSSNAHRVGYSDGGSIRKSKSNKYFKFISRLVSGRGIGISARLPQSMLVHQNFGKEYVYWDDPNELVDRLRLLAASYQAGNHSHTNEIMSILEELREGGYIE